MKINQPINYETYTDLKALLNHLDEGVQSCLTNLDNYKYIHMADFLTDFNSIFQSNPDLIKTLLSNLIAVKELIEAEVKHMRIDTEQLIAKVERKARTEFSGASVENEVTQFLKQENEATYEGQSELFKAMVKPNNPFQPIYIRLAQTKTIEELPLFIQKNPSLVHIWCLFHDNFDMCCDQCGKPFTKRLKLSVHRTNCEKSQSINVRAGTYQFLSLKTSPEKVYPIYYCQFGCNFWSRLLSEIGAHLQRHSEADLKLWGFSHQTITRFIAPTSQLPQFPKKVQTRRGGLFEKTKEKYRLNYCQDLVTRDALEAQRLRTEVQVVDFEMTARQLETNEQKAYRKLGSIGTSQLSSILSMQQHRIKRSQKIPENDRLEAPTFEGMLDLKKQREKREPKSPLAICSSS